MVLVVELLAAEVIVAAADDMTSLADTTGRAVTGVMSTAVVEAVTAAAATEGVGAATASEADNAGTGETTDDGECSRFSLAK